MKPPTTREYRDTIPDAPHDTKAGLERVLNFARKGKWNLTTSTKERAEALGVDVSGVKFRELGL